MPPHPERRGAAPALSPGGRSPLIFTWTLVPNTLGWAECVIADDHAEATTHASYVTSAPEDLLTAVTRLFGDATAANLHHTDEPSVHRWDLRRDGDRVHIQITRFRGFSSLGEPGTQVWSSTQRLDVLARAVIRAFDEVHREHGVPGYQQTWGRPFPSFELDLLRLAFRGRSAPRSRDRRTPRHRR